MHIEPLGNHNNDRIAEIAVAAESEGIRFINRLTDEWQDGSNRFDQPGEILFAGFEGDRMICIGGVNKVSESTGRVRRFYVLPDYRRRGMGTALIAEIIEHSSRHFTTLELRSMEADAFWRAQGFEWTGRDNPTHRLRLL